MTTSIYAEGEWLLSMDLDMTGIEDWSDATLPESIPANLDIIGIEALADGVLAFSYINRSDPTAGPEGTLLIFRDPAEAIEHEHSRLFDLPNDPDWWVNDHNQPWPRHRWTVVGLAL